MPDFLSSLVPSFLALHQQTYLALTKALRAMTDGSASLWQPIVFALALGALHAMTPGHGKAILVSYFLGRDARPAAGLLAGLKIAASHVVVAALLVTFFQSTVSIMGRPSGVAETVETLAYAAIAASGAWLLYQTIARPGTQQVEVREDGHTHLAPTVAGLIPCPLTMLLLVYALARADLWVTVVLVVTLAIGIAVTLGLVALSAIAIRRLAVARLDLAVAWYRRAACGLEIVSSVAILGIGLVLLTPRL